MVAVFSSLHLPSAGTGFLLLPCLLAGYLVVSVIYNRYFHPLAKFPGPFFASISHWWLIWEVFMEKPTLKFRALHEKYGPIVRVKPNELSISDPEAIKLIYGTKTRFTKTDFYVGWRGGIGRHPDLFTEMDEKEHAERRRIVNNLYSLSSIVQSEKYIDSCVELFDTRMEEYADEEEPFNLAGWLQWYAFDVIGELFFGSMFGFMRDKHDYGNYIGGLDAIFPLNTVATVMPLSWRPYLLLSGALFPGIRRGLKAFLNVAEEARSAVNERERMLNAGEKPRKDITATLFDIMHEKGAKVDFGKEDVMTEIWVALLAGMDTTAGALSAILYYVLRDPDVYNRLVEEVLEADKAGQLSRPIIRYGEASKLPYLDACCKEGMRIHPSVALTMPRHAPPEGCEITGQFIAGGYRVGINAGVVHMDKTVFGEDADRFVPERWLREDAAKMSTYMLQFGQGARSCLGKSISIVEMYKLIPQLLRAYHIELVDPEWKTVNNWFHRVREIKVRFQRR